MGTPRGAARGARTSRGAQPRSRPHPCPPPPPGTPRPSASSSFPISGRLSGADSPLPACSYLPFIQKVNSQLQEFASQSSGVEYLDCGSRFLDTNRNLNRNYVEPDGISLSYLGTTILAQCIARALEGVSGLHNLPYDGIWANR